jgi:tRNA isopentenyl-2-thiomethyl-A-37 hydroxylase MiaE
MCITNQLMSRENSWLGSWLDRSIRTEIMRQPSAKGFLLSAYSDAESSGEGEIFDKCLQRATDPTVIRMMQKHRDDEIRHGKLLADRRDELGLPAYEIPPALQWVERLSDEAGGTFDLPMDKPGDIVAAYQLLYVVEERALKDFALLAEVLEETGDDVTAKLFRTIAKDEARHLRYCEAIGRRYSSTDAEWDEGVAHLRQIEADFYEDQGRKMMKHLVANELFTYRGFIGLIARTAIVVDEWISPSDPVDVQPAAAAK